MRYTRTLTVTYDIKDIKNLLLWKTEENFGRPPTGYTYIVEEDFNNYTVYLKPKRENGALGEERQGEGERDSGAVVGA